MFDFDLMGMIAGLPGLLIALVFHEYAHARMAVAMGDFTPKFVKHFGDAGAVMREAFQAYTQEVRDGVYPTEQYGYKG